MFRVAAEHFSIKYDGPAVGDNNDIDASTFGGSLIALSDLIQEAQDVLEPDGARYRVRVKSTGPGSFEVFLELRELWDAVVKLLNTPEATAIGLLTTLFGTGAMGLIGLHRFLDGRRPDAIIQTGDQTIFLVDKQEMIVERRVATLYQSKKIRRSLRQFVQPVRRGSIDSLTIKLPKVEPTVITPDDRPALESPEDDEPDLDETVPMNLQIETIRWRTNRWEFREPHTGLFWATIEDQDFLTRIDERTEPMNKGDSIEAVVRVRQWDQGDGTFKTDHTILSVLGHQGAERPVQMTIDEP